MPPYRAPPGLSKLRTSKKYVDLRLKCGDDTFDVHRAIICSQSEFFARACDGLFRESQDRVIELHEDNPRHISLMVDFLYTSDYNDHPIPNTMEIDNTTSDIITNDDENHVDGSSEIPISPPPRKTLKQREAREKQEAIHSQLINTSLYALGDKYDIPELKNRSIEKFAEVSAIQWIAGMNQILRAVYKTTPQNDRGLRDIVIEVYTTYTDEMRAQGQNHDAVLRDIPEAHVDILKAQLEDERGTKDALTVERDQFQAQLRQEQKFSLQLTRAFEALFCGVKAIRKCRFCSNDLLNTARWDPDPRTRGFGLRCQICGRRYDACGVGT